MPGSFRRLRIAFGALVEAALAIWLLSGFLPAGLPLGLLTVLFGLAIYRDIPRREQPPLGRLPPGEPTTGERVWGVVWVLFVVGLVVALLAAFVVAIYGPCRIWACAA